MRAVSAEALPRGGIVDKFVGDGAMIVFGLERESASDAVNAIACAKALTSVTLDWSQERADVGENSMNVAMGLHWGEAFIGAVGDEKRLEFTVLGDVVNVASRLEAFAKQQDEPLIVSVDALDRARESGSDWRNLGKVTVRNREASIELFAPA